MPQPHLERLHLSLIHICKSQGNKRYEIGEDQAAWIVRTYVDGHDHGRSVIVPVENFMYRKVTTQRPLRVVIEPSVDGLDALFTLSKPMEKLSDASRAAIRSWVCLLYTSRAHPPGIPRP